ncbi:MAG: hypothetical protein K6U80_20155 [Firmicutes bacterium]|nr:hypothetical protein [Bacillota bacterium]
MPKDEDTLVAKKIFFEFGGSHFHMAREGVYDTYKKFNISKKQELIWINEYLNVLFSKINDKTIIDDEVMDLMRIIREYKQINHFEKLLDWAKTINPNADSFTKLRLAEEILDIIKLFKKESTIPKCVKDAKIFALDVLHEINRKPITVAQYYKNIGYLKNFLDDGVIKKRIEMRLKEWNSDTMVNW